MTLDDTPTPEEQDEAGEQDPGTGSDEGGDLETPSAPFGEEPPSADQDANEAVSGGGMVQPDAQDDPKQTVDPEQSG